MIGEMVARSTCQTACVLSSQARPTLSVLGEANAPTLELSRLTAVSLESLKVWLAGSF